jgi:hypothetical protein
MAKKRYIDTRFWSDNFIVELDPLERYLFLYFLTNEHTTICGVYELPLRTMAYETGLDKEMLLKILPRFEGKVYYIDGWIYLKNFVKNQVKNASVEKGIEVCMSNIPDEIKKKIEQLDTESDSLGTAGGEAPTYLNTNTNTNTNSNTKKATPKTVADLNGLIELFKPINPSYDRLFRNKTQRDALTRLVMRWSREEVEKMIRALPYLTSQKGCPQVTTPYALERDLGRLLIFSKQQKSTNKNTIASAL